MRNFDTMRTRQSQWRYRAVRIVAAVSLAAGGMAIANAAIAATAGLSDANMTNPSWKHYTVTRTSTLTTIRFDPANSELDGSLLHQVAAQYALNLKLQTPAGSDISAQQSWVNVRTSKDIISGLATGTQFRMAACCYSALGGDSYWSGTLTY